MIKVAFLFLSTGIALVVAVALIVGIAWLAVAVPVLIATAAGYGFLSLRRRAWRGKTHGNRTKILTRARSGP